MPFFSPNLFDKFTPILFVLSLLAEFLQA